MNLMDYEVEWDAIRPIICQQLKVAVEKSTDIDTNEIYLDMFHALAKIILEPVLELGAITDYWLGENVEKVEGMSAVRFGILGNGYDFAWESYRLRVGAILPPDDDSDDEILDEKQ